MTSTLLRTPRRLATLGAGLFVTAALLSGCAQDASEDDSPAVSESSEESTSSVEVEMTTDDTGDVVEATYDGQEGETALDLLTEGDPEAVVSGEGENGFVTGIGGREADDTANEFWAFYVNGEQAQVGAGVYTTTDEDVVTWKLETF
ncbi:DUF4430 domain-containing protein [Paraoerskovia marina]|uniref:DUF4430 domain-containing protein n=1 Tax=Paraoerskovia marina TaxID=545619 RepID=UPI000492BCB8|nr:DUF4430 domain-containing protein [Paraoerskovia marina]